MLIWKCECGWESKSPGGQGMGEALLHIRIGKREGTKHSCFLFDTDAQKAVLDTEGKVIKSLAKAQSLGIIPIVGKAKKEPPKGPAQKVGGDLATVLQPSRGAIVFTLGEHKIPLNPQHLYDAYLYYEDMMLREGMDEEFSLAIKDCVKVAWERLNHRRDEGRRASITMEEG